MDGAYTRSTSTGTGRPRVASPVTRRRASPVSVNPQSTAGPLVGAMAGDALRPSSRRNGLAVRSAVQVLPATESTEEVGWAMTSPQCCLSDGWSHQVMHSAFAAGSPVKVRTIRIAASFAIAGAIR